MTSPSRTTARRSAMRGRIRARQAFEQGELPVVVAELDAADDQPPVPGPQAPETVEGSVPRRHPRRAAAVAACRPPTPEAAAPARLRRAAASPAAARRGCGSRRPAAGRPALALPRFDSNQSRRVKVVAQRFLNDVAGVDRAPPALGQAAPRTSPEPGPVPLEQRFGRPPGCPAGPAPGGVTRTTGWSPNRTSARASTP